MDATVVLLFVILSAGFALVAILLFKRKPGRVEESAEIAYAEGLNLLLANDKNEALRKLREAVSKDSQNVDAYLKIGDILREQGRAQRAINVHKYLTVRAGLTAKQRQSVLQSLARDYQVAHEHENALRVLDKVLSLERHASWAQEMKVEIHENQEEWALAFKAYKELPQRNGELKNKKLASYKVQEGKQLLGGGLEKDAQLCFREAMKIDPHGAAAYICLADSYKRENRSSEALKILKDFARRVPSYAFLVFERIEDLMYDSGIYGEIEAFYLDLIKREPNSLRVQLALAETYDKKGEREKAINMCLEILDQKPQHLAARKHLVRLYHLVGKDKEALRIALELIDESAETSSRADGEPAALAQNSAPD